MYDKVSSIKSKQNRKKNCQNATKKENDRIWLGIESHHNLYLPVHYNAQEKKITKNTAIAIADESMYTT